MTVYSEDNREFIKQEIEKFLTDNEILKVIVSREPNYNYPDYQIRITDGKHSVTDGFLYYPEQGLESARLTLSGIAERMITEYALERFMK